MTATHALMQAILRDPADDAPRLIYADELDAAGECERAEFVRVQIAYAKEKEPELKTIGRISFDDGRDVGWRDGGLCVRCRDVACRYHVLEDRMKELWPNVYDWFPGIDKLVPQGDDWRHYISRGFPSAIALPMAQFMGGPCERCGGTGTTTRDDLPKCRPCSGTGHVPGLIDTIFSRWAITEVRLTDREPAEWSEESGENRYVWTKRDNDLIEAPCDLPLELFNRMQSGELNRGIWARRYPTRDAALLALSHAATDLGRERAGLPAIRRGRS